MTRSSSDFRILSSLMIGMMTYVSGVLLIFAGQVF